MPMPPPRLTARQNRFVEQYLVHLNATQACIEAGFSAHTAAAAGSRLLRNVKVATAIRDAQKARAARVGIEQDRVLAELEEMAFSDISDYVVSDTGDVTLSATAAPRAMHAVQSVKRRTNDVGEGKDRLRTIEVEIKLWDKGKMLTLVARHVGVGREQRKRGDDLVPVSQLSDETLAMLEADLARLVH
jgi:phage terminase small subunit